MMGLGAYADPQSGRAVIDIQGAQFAIDLLGVIEEKTRGNLTADEASELTEILAQLRARFVQIAKLVAAQMQREMAGGGMPGAMPPPVAGAELGAEVGADVGADLGAEMGAEEPAPVGAALGRARR